MEDKNKKLYMTPEMNIVLFNDKDILIESNEDPNEGEWT